ncbi:hypothetical protein A606_11640 [Corynebacterium terpenotabidum Y-11]|uniref:Uncharacterized protein n=1 Tax=Corynebacterium terpenotabidum Y-11 TaxID=1200352 RepID=S4XFS0_9CORY|nr:hypothetical protein A606_11640 [Corynebacterium terpenotabidum Y-11]
MIDFSASGSSPITRRARGGEPHRHGGEGIIPARAGSTSRETSWVSPPWDPPRSRGEHYEWKNEGRDALGSSPLARGARQFLGQFGGGQGIIPARAGSTRLLWSMSAGCWDHPRSRGEHQASRQSFLLPMGSSPLARGAPCRSLRGWFTCGIIPARAGSTKGYRVYQSV